MRVYSLKTSCYIYIRSEDLAAMRSPLEANFHLLMVRVLSAGKHMICSGHSYSVQLFGVAVNFRRPGINTCPKCRIYMHTIDSQGTDSLCGPLLVKLLGL